MRRTYQKPIIHQKEFSTDKPIENGHIYLIEQNGERKVHTCGSNHELTGRWIVKMKFEDKRGDSVTEF